MKKNLIIFSAIIGIIFSFVRCEPFIENKIIIQNNAAADVKLNIAGKIYNIPAGNNVVLADFKKGTFGYETIYSVPLGITTSSAEGAVSGQMKLLAGTEILLVYTSITDAETYTLYGSLTSSDDVNRTDPFLSTN